MKDHEVTPEEVLHLLRQQDRGHCFIDVRSQSENQKGRIPHFHALPILTDAERHQVGLCYKDQGSQAAVRLGHRLVAPDREKRIDAWRRTAGDRPIIVSCWRGGLRSEIAAGWMREAGLAVRRVQGGYRALRRELLKRLDDLPELLVLTGLTGSGKTDLIHRIHVPKVDLEGLANHRGSAFGGFSDSSQPSQATFENQLLLDLPHAVPWVLVEDESAFVGSVSIPKPVVERIKKAPVVYLDSSLEERAVRIFREYVGQPLELGTTPEMLGRELRSKLDRLAKPLGGQRHQTLTEALMDAFERDPSDERLHIRWIGSLLTWYYDPRYRYGIERNQRPVVFQGDFHACLDWLSARADNPISSWSSR